MELFADAPDPSRDDLATGDPPPVPYAVDVASYVRREHALRGLIQRGSAAWRVQLRPAVVKPEREGRRRITVAHFVAGAVGWATMLRGTQVVGRETMRRGVVEQRLLDDSRDE
eukprot:gene42418-52884_t